LLVFTDIGDRINRYGVGGQGAGIPAEGGRYNAPGDKAGEDEDCDQLVFKKILNDLVEHVIGFMMLA